MPFVLPRSDEGFEMTMLTDTVVLLTGASKGIGAATAKKLLEEGATVIGTYNSGIGALEDLGQQYGAGRLLALKGNLGDASTTEVIWQQALGFKGHIDAIVNNAGTMTDVGVGASDSEWHQAWQQTMAVNVQAVADLCRRAILHFKETGGGSIVSIASRAAQRGDTIDYMHYAASKGAVVSLMKSIARGYAADNIMAYTIAPGWVKTDMAAVGYEPGNEHMFAEIPMGEPAPPEEIGNLIAFLLSGQARHTTGSTFDINGASYVR